jgi:hypothetical protein
MYVRSYCTLTPVRALGTAPLGRALGTAPLGQALGTAPLGHALGTTAPCSTRGKSSALRNIVRGYQGLVVRKLRAPVLQHNLRMTSEHKIKHICTVHEAESTEGIHMELHSFHKSVLVQVGLACNLAR